MEEKIRLIQDMVAQSIQYNLLCVYQGNKNLNVSIYNYNGATIFTIITGSDNREKFFVYENVAKLTIDKLKEIGRDMSSLIGRELVGGFGGRNLKVPELIAALQVIQEKPEEVVDFNKEITVKHVTDMSGIHELVAGQWVGGDK